MDDAELCKKLHGVWNGRYCEVEIYHGTTENNAEEIMKNGFKIPDESDEWFYGRGAYFSLNPEKAESYGRKVLRAMLDIDMKNFCWINPLEGIGTYEQYAEEHCKSMNDECFRKYTSLAKLEQQQMLYEGCKVRSDGKQIVIHDENTLKKLRFTLM